jgi:hypothetical protein
MSITQDKAAIAQLFSTVTELRRENAEMKQSLAAHAGSKKATEEEVLGLSRQAEAASAELTQKSAEDEQLFARVQALLDLIENEE